MITHVKLHHFWSYFRLLGLPVRLNHCFSAIISDEKRQKLKIGRYFKYPFGVNVLNIFLENKKNKPASADSLNFSTSCLTVFFYFPIP